MQVNANPLPRPLEDVTVLDLTTALAGPFATLLLAGLGARVIKIESPTSPDTCRENAPYLGAEGATLARRHPDDISISALNRLRNKQGVTLNLKNPEAQPIFADLLRKADIVVENFSRGTIDRLGAGYDFAREVNPRIVYCSISGFGNESAAGSGKAADAIIQALSGLMLTSGNAGDPPVRIGVPFADLSAPLFGVIGLLAALLQARRTGMGQHVDVSMLGVLTMLVASEPFDVLERCGVPARTGQTAPRLAPFGIYPARDGYLAICAFTEAFAKNLFVAIGRPELTTDARFANRDARVTNVAEVDRIVEEFTRAHSVKEAVATLEQAGVPAAEVRDPTTAVRDPRVVARGETMPLVHPKFGAADDVYGMGLPLKFSGAWTGFDEPPPAVGEHNNAVYGDLLGYSTEQIERLRAEKII